jgi:SAM-dependent methyltransferase
MIVVIQLAYTKDKQMHDTAQAYGELFLDIYGRNFTATGNPVTLLEVGAGELPEFWVFKAKCDELGIHYRGMDQLHSDDPDVPYTLPAEDNSVDMIICSSVFEHDEMFWVTFLEMMRILKPNGVVYVNAPSNGVVHGWPVDCWRFYPDSANALTKWARRNHLNTATMENFTSGILSECGVWLDYVAVWIKDADHKWFHPSRILDVPDVANSATNASKN